MDEECGETIRREVANSPEADERAAHLFDHPIDEGATRAFSPILAITC